MNATQRGYFAHMLCECARLGCLRALPAPTSMSNPVESFGEGQGPKVRVANNALESQQREMRAESRTAKGSSPELRAEIHALASNKSEMRTATRAAWSQRPEI